MPAVDQAREWICDYPRTHQDTKQRWLEGAARFYRISFATAKKLYYREKKGIDADVYGRMADIHAQSRDLQSRALEQRGNLNDIAFAIADYRRDRRAGEAAQAVGATPAPGGHSGRGMPGIRAKA